MIKENYQKDVPLIRRDVVTLLFSDGSCGETDRLLAFDADRSHDRGGADELRLRLVTRGFAFLSDSRRCISAAIDGGMGSRTNSGKVSIASGLCKSSPGGIGSRMNSGRVRRASNWPPQRSLVPCR